MVTKNPGGTRLGQCIRQAVLDPEAGHIDGRVEVLLMFADRRHHLLEVVDPALAAGSFVLCDRFSDSTRAYQGHGRGVDLKLIDEVDELATGRRRPDRTLLFDVTAPEAQNRGQSANRREKEGGVDRIDAEDLAFYERVREGYRSLEAGEPEAIRPGRRHGFQGADLVPGGSPFASVGPRGPEPSRMNLEGALGLARRGELYPSLILHGAEEGQRQEAALELARCLLCEEQDRPCGACRHCRRIVWPGGGEEAFHPDFRVLERDLKTSTSVEAAKTFLKGAQVSPFEARGQVFVVANAETLTGEASNALLKNLEEPPESAPRHFLLLAPSQFDLLATLRSRSLAIFLGSGHGVDRDRARGLAQDFAAAVRAFSETGAGVYLQGAAAVLQGAGDFKDSRSSRPWMTASQTVLQCLTEEEIPETARRRLLDLAQALLTASDFRLRGIPAERILEGLVCRHLLAS